MGRIPHHLEVEMHGRRFSKFFFTISEEFGRAIPIGDGIVARANLWYALPHVSLAEVLLLERGVG